MKTSIKNQAIMNGDYDGTNLQLDSTIAETTLVTGIEATKTANKSVWSGGTLIYTVLVENTTDIAYTTPVFTDTLDANTTFVDGSVKIGGIAYEDYTFVAPILTINLPTIAAQSQLVITFEVEQV